MVIYMRHILKQVSACKEYNYENGITFFPSDKKIAHII